MRSDFSTWGIWKIDESANKILTSGYKLADYLGQWGMRMVYIAELIMYILLMN